MAERKLYVLSGDAQFDERRNTSRTFGVPVGAGQAVVDSLARSVGEPWYRWVVARRSGEHLHGSLMADGRSRAACPVRGCDG